MQPDWQIHLNDKIIRNKHLQQLSLIDKRGLEADQLSLVFSDTQQELILPNLGDTLRCAIGWHGETLAEKGRYRIQSVEHSGPPDQISLNAISTDVQDTFLAQKERSWHDTTFGTLVQTIAAEHGLQLAMAPALSGLAIPHLDQTHESDANLLTRLAEQFDALASVKNGYLVLMPLAQRQTASGKPLPIQTFIPATGNQHRFRQSDQQARFSGVKATWNNQQQGSRESVIIGAEGYLRTLKSTFPSEIHARQAAQAEWNRLKRGQFHLELTLAVGLADLIPEMPVALMGYHPAIQKVDWVCTEITHTLNGQGYQNQVQLESD